MPKCAIAVILHYYVATILGHQFFRFRGIIMGLQTKRSASEANCESSTVGEWDGSLPVQHNADDSKMDRILTMVHGIQRFYGVVCACTKR